MEWLIVSDTHGRASRLSDLVADTRARELVFLGDGLRDLSCLPDHVTVYAVRGNCDFFGAGNDVPTERLEFLGGCRVFLTHGHRYGVKSSLDAAIAAAARADADVLLYGHTHEPFEETLPAGSTVCDTVLRKPLLVACPGSLGEPPRGAPFFATLTVRGGVPLIGFGNL